MNFPQFFPPLFSFLFTLLGIWLCLKFFPRLRLMDRPQEFGFNRPSVPYSAGIIFFIVFVVSVFIFSDITLQIAGVMLAALLIVFVSFIDDRVRISPILRLFVQILVGVLVVFAGVKIQLINNPFGAPIYLDGLAFNFFGQQIWIFSALLVVAWLVLMMNAMNWLDGIPGLASGVSTIAQVALFILATRQFNVVDQSAIIAISSVLAASTFVFVFFDFYPPKILMGDTGSMFLGFMLGTLSILAGGKLATALLIMGFPVLDAFWVILRRMLKGKSPFRGDFSHFHHRLLHIGLSEKKALCFNYFFCAAFAVIALSLHSAFAKFIAFGAVFAVMLGIGIVLTVTEKH